MDAILLAAGNSRRFGENKLLHKIYGKPMYQYILDYANELKLEGKLDHVVVVTQYDEIGNDIKESKNTISVVKNENPEHGISHSIALGLERLQQISAKSEACLFAVCDQPYLKKETLAGFIEESKQSKQGIAICACGTRMGNPVIFCHNYYGELAQIKGDKGGKQVVMHHLDDTFFYQVPEVELEDIDVRRYNETNG